MEWVEKLRTIDFLVARSPHFPLALKTFVFSRDASPCGKHSQRGRWRLRGVVKHQLDNQSNRQSNSHERHERQEYSGLFFPAETMSVD